MRLSKEVTFKLKDKVITIIEHADRAGKKASRNWGKQLTTGTSTTILTFRIAIEIKDPSIKDLADFVAAGMPSPRAVDRLRKFISRKRFL